MIYRFHNHFTKSYRKLPNRIRKMTDEKLLLFSSDPFFTILNNHPLTGEYKGYRSINITGNYRAIYKETSNDEVIFIKIGTHPELYG